MACRHSTDRQLRCDLRGKRKKAQPPENTPALNPIDLENWSYGWSLSFQRYGPDPRFFQKTWDLIVSRGPKPLNVLMTLKSSRSRDGQGLDPPFLNSTQRSGVEFKRERSQRSKRASNAMTKRSALLRGAWGEPRTSGVQGQRPGGGVQGCVRTHPWRGSGRGAPRCRNEAPRSPNAQAVRSRLAACNSHGALPAGTTAPYPNPCVIKISRVFSLHPRSRDCPVA
jgi:hypothetical protein